MDYKGSLDTYCRNCISSEHFCELKREHQEGYTGLIKAVMPVGLEITPHVVYLGINPYGGFELKELQEEYGPDKMREFDVYLIKGKIVKESTYIKEIIPEVTYKGVKIPLASGRSDLWSPDLKKGTLLQILKPHPSEMRSEYPKVKVALTGDHINISRGLMVEIEGEYFIPIFDGNYTHINMLLANYSKLGSVL